MSDTLTPCKRHWPAAAEEALAVWETETAAEAGWEGLAGDEGEGAESGL